MDIMEGSETIVPMFSMRVLLNLAEYWQRPEGQLRTTTAFLDIG